MRLGNGKLWFSNDHFQRLSNGAKALGMELPSILTSAYLQSSATELADKNNYSNARIRLTLYREAEGKYLPTSNQSSFLITSDSLEDDRYVLNENGLTIGLFDGEKKSNGILANHKTTSALLYVLAAQSAQQNGWDDSLIVNSEGRVIESIASNIFLVKGTHLHTPPLSEGPIAGVMRKQVLQLATANGFGLSSGQVTKDMLTEADEVLLTNVISGIRWVGRYGTKTYGNKVAGQLADILNKSLA